MLDKEKTGLQDNINNTVNSSDLKRPNQSIIAIAV